MITAKQANQTATIANGTQTLQYAIEQIKIQSEKGLFEIRFFCDVLPEDQMTLTEEQFLKSNGFEVLFSNKPIPNYTIKWKEIDDNP